MHMKPPVTESTCVSQHDCLLVAQHSPIYAPSTQQGFVAAHSSNVRHQQDPRCPGCKRRPCHFTSAATAACGALMQVPGCICWFKTKHPTSPSSISCSSSDHARTQASFLYSLLQIAGKSLATVLVNPPPPPDVSACHAGSMGCVLSDALPWCLCILQ